MKVYLDDYRKAPFGWERAYTAAECIEFLETGKVTHLSLDHDLAPAHYEGALDSLTGYAVVLWLENEVMTNSTFQMPVVELHTMNPAGREHMARGLARIAKFIAERENGKPEEKPQELEVKSIELLRNTTFYCQVCSNYTRNEIEQKTNMINPAGTQGGWKLCETAPNGDPDEVDCLEKKGYKHYLLVCILIVIGI